MDRATSRELWGNREQKGQQLAEKSQNLFYQKAAVLGPRMCAWAAKLERQTRCPVDATEASKGKGQGVTAPARMSNNRVFKLSGEPFYGGKGKCRNVNPKEGDSVVHIPTTMVDIVSRE